MGNNFTEGKKNSWHIWKGVWVESCQRQDFAQKKETSHLESSLSRFCAIVTQEGKPVRCGVCLLERAPTPWGHPDLAGKWP